jgi:3-dehydroquinate synthetase
MLRHSPQRNFEQRKQLSQCMPSTHPAPVSYLLPLPLCSYRSPQEAQSANNPFKPLNGYTARPEPLPRAPENVFVFKREGDGKVLGWRNVFQLPIQYDVELCPGGVLSFESTALATRLMPTGGAGRRRFLVVDAAVHKLYGASIARYFDHHGIAAHSVVLPGEECNKRMEAVDAILDALCAFGLHRREPIIGIGGGVLLDIVGLAANLYRRGVPYIRVPTTLLALVDASVGVKNGVDYCSCSCGPQKNRVGSFYAPAAALLDKAFVATQDARNVVNGLGEIMKLALVRSAELFALLEAHGPRLVRERFQGADGAADRVIELSIQIMLEELGPNLWEQRLERCVDYGHTFSKIFEMVPGADLMHGEAVNVDGALCPVLAQRRGLIGAAVRDRALAAMRAVGLPTLHPAVTPAHLMQVCMFNLPRVPRPVYT